MKQVQSSDNDDVFAAENEKKKSSHGKNKRKIKKKYGMIATAEQQ